jgi:hypothetical protein
MSIDMYESSFLRELNKLPEYKRQGEFDRRVWNVGFPAWRAIFSSLCLYGHSSGYRLPPFDSFLKQCKSAFTHEKQEEEKRERWRHFFEGEFELGMLHRISVWYESGMAETYLYACLVDAIEDQNSKCGIVLYDPRGDWKLKVDAFVIVKNLPMMVSAFFGKKSDHAALKTWRDKKERIRKKNAMKSAHWENSGLATMKELEIACTDDDMQVVNGVRLFSITAINNLLRTIYQHAEVEERGYYFFPEER